MPSLLNKNLEAMRMAEWAILEALKIPQMKTELRFLTKAGGYEKHGFY